jgi:hypothetical protein
VASGSSPPSADIEDHGIVYTSETGTEPSSAESTTPHSPPDLSAYSPANWADANSFVPHNGYNPHWYTQQQQQQPHHHHYYGPPHHKRHYYSRQNSYHSSYGHQYHYRGSSGYMSDRAAACLPSSGGDSLAEEEEELRPVEGQACTVDESSEVTEKVSASEKPSKQAQQLQQQQQQQQQPQRVFIPGLPERLATAAATNGKKVQKKRRKKKAASSQNANCAQDDHSVRSSLKSEVALPSTLSSSEEDLCQAVQNEEEKVKTVDLSRPTPTSSLPQLVSSKKRRRSKSS